MSPFVHDSAVALQSCPSGHTTRCMRFALLTHIAPLCSATSHTPGTSTDVKFFKFSFSAASYKLFMATARFYLWYTSFCESTLYNKENFEKTPKTSRYAPKVYREWGGKRGKSKYSKVNL